MVMFANFSLDETSLKLVEFIDAENEDNNDPIEIEKE